MNKTHTTAVATALLAICARAWSQASAPEAARDLTLSLGAVKEQLETSGVRALVKFANARELDEALKSPGGPSFYILNRKIDVDVTDKGTFGGLSMRYGVTRFFAPIKIVEGVKVTDSSGWMHTIPMTLGLDASRRLDNRDVLLEVAYVPFKGLGVPSCFKLGGNPVVGVVGQAGHRTRQDAPADFKSSLARLRLEAKASFLLGPCFGIGKGAADRGAGFLDVLAIDIANWRVLIDASATRDFVDKKNYRHAALAIRMPAAKGSFVDLRREVGSAAPNFEKGSQYGVYLTVQY